MNAGTRLEPQSYERDALERATEMGIDLNGRKVNSALHVLLDKIEAQQRKIYDQRRRIRNLLDGAETMPIDGYYHDAPAPERRRRGSAAAIIAIAGLLGAATVAGWLYLFHESLELFR